MGLTVHLLRLQHPGGASLVVERPKHGDEGEQRDQLGECDEAVAGEDFFEKPDARSRDVDEAVAT
jgi:hypothetical protein